VRGGGARSRLPSGVAITSRISRTLADALDAHRAATGESLDHVVRAALADYLQVDHGTLYQVSTAGALVEGLSRGEVTVGALKQHGDFGLGTFDALDGEMVALDGRFFQVAADGGVREVDDGATTPYAMITRFVAEACLTLEPCASLAQVRDELDRLRRSDNHFYAVRIDGRFELVRARAVARPRDGRLMQAAAAEREFEWQDVDGTLVGFWSPAYAARLTVPGYHLHFLARDRAAGGHVLDCRGHGLRAEMQHEADLRLALPESPDFLRADLTRDPTTELNRAERGGG
jgi:acetolactate decarboxylase